MKTIKTMPRFVINLQMFDGTASVTATTGEGQETAAAEQETKQNTPKVIYGRPPADNGEVKPETVQETEESTTQQPKSAEELSAEFEKSIKGDYKPFFDAHVQQIIDGRFKNTKQLQGFVDKLSPLLEAAADRYKVKSNDIDAIIQKFTDDTSYLEQEAQETGISVEQLKQNKKTALENKRLQAELDARKAEEAKIKTFSEWQRQEGEIKNKYPGFDLRNQLNNQRFADMVYKGATLEEAYRATNFDDIMASMLQYATNKAKQDTVETIKSNGSRPAENASSPAQPAVEYKYDSSRFTREDWARIDEMMKEGKDLSNII
jgi:hypothetical protein